MIKAFEFPKLPTLSTPNRQITSIDVEVEYSDEFPFKLLFDDTRIELTYKEADKLRSYLQAMLQDYDMVKADNND